MLPVYQSKRASLGAQASAPMSYASVVPSIQLEDDRALAESNAILMQLAGSTPRLPDYAFDNSKAWQWLSL